jgi:RNA polymerase sigma factor (sigma-70 family)
MSQTWEGSSDNELVAACARHPINEAAWFEFWRRFQPLIQRRVLAALLRFTKHVQRSDLDDLIQFVFLKVLQNLDRFDPAKGAWRAYLSTVTANVVIDEFRKNKIGNIVPLEEADSSLVAYDPGVDLMAEWDAVAVCLEKLGESKATMIAEYLQGQDVGKICQQYGISEGNLYTIVSRFRKELRSLLR